jgi:hypothetical protein
VEKLEPQGGMSCHPACKADWSGLKFKRARSDRAFVELERSRLKAPWLKLIAHGFALLLFFLSLWAVCR